MKSNDTSQSYYTMADKRQTNEGQISAEKKEPAKTLVFNMEIGALGIYIVKFTIQSTSERVYTFNTIKKRSHDNTLLKARC